MRIGINGFGRVGRLGIVRKQVGPTIIKGEKPTLSDEMASGAASFHKHCSSESGKNAGEMPFLHYVLEKHKEIDVILASFSLFSSRYLLKRRFLPFYYGEAYMQAALDHLRVDGYAVLDGDLEHLSQVLSSHILLHGSHHFDLQAPKKRQGQLRPLRIAAPLL